MKLSLRIPLCWKGKRVYDPVNDELRGGWLWFGLRLKLERTQWPSGVQFTIQWRVGLRS